MSGSVQFRLNAESVRWLVLLPRWSLLVAFASLALAAVLIGAVGLRASDLAQGPEYIELLQAVRSPTLYRLGWMIDAFVWLLIGGSLMILGHILHRQSPIIATLIVISGIAQVIGFLGTLTRLHGTLDLALVYSMSTIDQRYAILDEYSDLWRVIMSYFLVPLFFSGVGYLLAARKYFTLVGFPRWLAAWFAIPGLLAFTQFSVVALGMPKVEALNYIGVGFGNIALNSTVAFVLWQPSRNLITSLSTFEEIHIYDGIC